MEVDLDDMNPLDAVKFITSNGTLPADQIARGRRGREALCDASRKLAASLDVPEIVIAKLEPWAAALVLTQFALNKTGFDRERSASTCRSPSARAPTANPSKVSKPSSTS